MSVHEHEGAHPASRPPFARGPRLPSGLRCTLRRPSVPGLRDYYVVALQQHAVSSRDVADLSVVAHRVGRLLGQMRYSNPECYTLMYNAARTRRCPWPHVHVLVTASVPGKRRSMLLLQLKHLLRWRRWPLLRLLTSPCRVNSTEPSQVYSAVYAEFHQEP